MEAPLFCRLMDSAGSIGSCITPRPIISLAAVSNSILSPLRAIESLLLRICLAIGHRGAPLGAFSNMHAENELGSTRHYVTVTGKTDGRQPSVLNSKIAAVSKSEAELNSHVRYH